MAEKLDALEKQWLQKALDTQIAVLRRSMSKELPGSDIVALRQKEIDVLIKLKGKV